MTKKQPPNPKQDKSNPTPPSGAADSNPTNREQDDKDSQPSAQTGQKIKRERQPRLPVKDRKWYKIATDPATPNFIGALYTVATIILLVATYFILRATRESVKSSNDAATAAAKADSISENALTETRREFNLINEPFLEIDSMKFDPAKRPGTFQMNYLLTNLTNTVVKIYSLQKVYVFDTVPKFKIPEDTTALKETMKMALAQHLQKDINLYLTKEAPMHEFGVTDAQHDLTPYTMLYYAQKRVKIYQICVVKYQSSISGKTRYYWSEIELNIIPYLKGFIIYPVYMYNENEDE